MDKIIKKDQYNHPIVDSTWPQEMTWEKMKEAVSKLVKPKRHKIG